jgi:ribosomal protein L29
MKRAAFKQDLKKMDVHGLQEKIEGLRRELFGLRLNATTSHVKDYSQFARLRKDIARAMTYLKQKSKHS